MADKFTKVAVDSPAIPEAQEDAWKDAQVEKEHQPPKVKSQMTYRQLEQQVVNIDAQITSLGEQKTSVEAEMAKVKSAVEA
jgi:predicted  nucleic acid-binding Zn-ribbon protein